MIKAPRYISVKRTNNKSYNSKLAQIENNNTNNIF